MLAVIFHPYVLIPLLFLAAVCFLVFKKLRNSPKFDKWCNELETGKVVSKPSSKEVINKIEKAEDGLKDMASDKEKESKKLKKESDNITKHLTDRGLSKGKKGGKATG